jgi:hypothetical protein
VEDFTNYYESLVLSCILHKLRGLRQAHNDEYIADVACVALNKLPARYVRHIVDARFFESEADVMKNNASVDAAVNFAIEFINSRTGMSPDGSLNEQKRTNS